MASTPTDPRIFSAYDATPKPFLRTFHLFVDLPAELHLHIWHLVLSKSQRLLRVRLRRQPMIDAQLTQARLSNFGALQDHGYGVLLDSTQRLSSLFFTNRESHDAALSYYRVQIACWFSFSLPRSKVLTSRTLYFHPESDLLQITSGTDHIAEFLHDQKTIHDSNHVGLLNVAFNFSSIVGSRGLYGVDTTLLDLFVQTSFKETFSQLREVFFLSDQGTGRESFRDWTVAPNDDYRLNHALPIFTSTVNFDHLGPDPRPIDQHLSNVFVKRDPRPMVLAFDQYIHKHFGWEKVMGAQYHILFTLGRGGEDERLMDIGRLLPPERRGLFEGQEYSSLDTAFGFWLLLPYEVFDKLPQRHFDACYIDLRENWPDLVSLSLN
ncbi:hypothetical protein F5Y16DRAFT_421972 [Xylariaceae sp. FL0255]|nr:hypothetical protein F5Y16DRAFT_421972 [Xylariaceae sp. FL0255]